MCHNLGEILSLQALQNEKRGVDFLGFVDSLVFEVFIVYVLAYTFFHSLFLFLHAAPEKL